jgi:hypothetical protein
VGAVTPGINPRRPRSIVLLDQASVINASGGAEIGGWGHKTALITVGTCTTYTLVFEVSADGTTWGTVLTKANTDYAQGVTAAIDLSAYSTKYLRARITAINSCAISLTLQMIP